jgi:1-aminocyclopropane-1-carboxylate deaminase/D-cysteine desulfhydrase-like pyridoxal-dependent ACC family enzyme
VAISAFSGSSQAGLLMGKQLAGLPGEIVGVPMAWTALAVREHVARTILRASARFGLAVEVPKSIHLLDGYQGVGREGVSDEHHSARKPGRQGAWCSTVYTAKAFARDFRRDPAPSPARLLHPRPAASSACSCSESR